MKKHRMAIMGAGHIAEKMAQTMRALKSVRCYAVASRDIKKAEQFAKKFGFQKAYGSYEELVKDEKVELIYIATPHSHHYACAMLCLQNAKAILCEKAFTVNVAQAEEILKLSREKQILAAEAMWTRYMPMVGMMREVLQSGIIGTPSVLTANLGYWLEDKQRVTDPALAGGALLDVGVYTLNFASMMFGDDVVRVESSCTYTDSGVDASDSITLHYRDGRMAVLCSTMRGISDRKGIIYGTKGYLVVENINNFESITAYERNNKKLIRLKCPKQITGFEYEVQACVKALEQGKNECEQMPHAQILNMMRLMDECRRQWGLRYPCEETPEKHSNAKDTVGTEPCVQTEDAVETEPYVHAEDAMVPGQQTEA